MAPPTLQRARILALAGLFLTLATSARAQSGASAGAAAKLAPETVEVARSALSRARKAWGRVRIRARVRLQ